MSKSIDLKYTQTVQISAQIFLLLLPTSAGFG